MSRAFVSRLRRLPDALRRRVRAAWLRRRDGTRCTYAAPRAISLRHLLPDLSEQIEPAQREALAAVTALYRDGFFDLLGSGWVPVYHGAAYRGLDGHRYGPGPAVTPDKKGDWLRGRVTDANLAASARAWELVPNKHTPLDWQVDFRSGYRWDEKTWFGDVPLAPAPGADPKLPWELGRMQHLPHLALAYGCARRGLPGFDDAEAYRQTFRTHVLDFIAQNPPRFGIQWRVPMDVAIRAANVLVAYDLFRAAGAAFDAAFEDILAASLLDHGRHIFAHLEKFGDRRNNHFLANLAGLAFLGAYLEAAEAKRWKTFAANALPGELLYQFNPDGMNFEASVFYHAFSLEMVEWTLAMLGDDGVLSESHRRRLARARQFLRDVTKPDGTLPQIGDNDSGRFLKLFPRYVRRTTAGARRRYRHLHDYAALPDNADYWDEDLLAAWDLPQGEERGALKTARFQPLSSSPVPGLRNEPAPDGDGWPINEEKGQRIVTRCPTCRPDLRRGVALASYSDSGLYLWRSDRLFLAVRCGPAVLKGLASGHAHLDQLAVELWLDGSDRFRDPGTATYLALPHLRNRYRSARAHFAPALGTDEPVSLPADPFALPVWHAARCLHADPHRFVGRFDGYGVPVYRRIEIADDAVVITDFTAETTRTLRVTPPDVPVSAGYGKLLDAQPFTPWCPDDGLAPGEAPGPAHASDSGGAA